MAQETPLPGASSKLEGGLDEPIGAGSTQGRLTLGSDEATLTEAEIESAVQAAVTQLTQRVGARLRG